MRRLLPLLPLLAMLAPGAAQACLMDLDYRPTPAQIRAQARQAVAGAAAIIDGEVIRPMVSGSNEPALVRAHRVLRGPDKTEFEVGIVDSCSRILTQRGERFRMILSGGPDVYYIFLHEPDGRAVDRILRSDRRRVWPYVAGSAPAR